LGSARRRRGPTSLASSPRSSTAGSWWRPETVLGDDVWGLGLALAGSPFQVGPAGALQPGERAVLARLACGGPPRGLAPFRLEIVAAPPWPGAALDAFADGAPAEVSAVGDRLRVTHRRFAAELDAASLSGRLFRREGDGGAIEIALRVALAARLPSLGGLPLHAAGLVLDGRGVVFFGPSGAGKSTISALAPGPVFSDEFVAVTLEPPTLRATGFWGESDGSAAPPGDVSLAALVELARGSAFRLERLDPRLALRRLLGVLMVPPHPGLWSAAMALAGEAARTVPVFRMAWTPDEPPWERLGAALRNL
jgi:hypothetical protein